MESDGSGRALVLRDTLAGIRLVGFFTKLLTALILAPSTGIEPVAYRLGGGRSIRLSYEGEGGALCGALLPVTVFLAVKVTGGSGLASWDRALAVSGRDGATCLPLSGGGSVLGGEGQLLAGSWSFDSVTSGAGAEEIESVFLNFESGFASCSPQGPIEAGLGWCVE
jgi:hypothetical protein